MILQALDSYYRQTRLKPDSGIPELGYSVQKIHAALVLDRSGKLVQVADLRRSEGKKLRPQALTVPEPPRRTVDIAPCFLWDNTGYVLGADNKANADRSRKTFDAFRELQHRLGDGSEDEGMMAVLHFLDSWRPGEACHLELWEELAGSNMVFRLADEHCYIHERPQCRSLWKQHKLEGQDAEYAAQCLVTGRKEALGRIHPAIKGVAGAQSSGAAIVSFNKDAFLSYAKTQSYNAPIGKEAAFTYTAALNHLLRFGSRNKVQIGDVTTVFWAEEKSLVEEAVSSFFSSDAAMDDHTLEDVKLLLEAMRDGKKPKAVKLDVPFYILGLSPNASRLSIRFWQVSSTGEMAQRLGQHFRDLKIIKSYDSDPDFPGLRQLLRETAVLRDWQNVSPLLSGALARTALNGGFYPESLLSSLITRIRADKQVNYLRAAAVKAFLARKYRLLKKNMEVPMVLDTKCENTGYRLGTLFAILEKIQRDANPNINATIKDRFYSAASSAPRSVMPQLIRLSQHHIKKAQKQAYHESLIQSVLANVETFPAYLNMEEQGFFALGYYHQRKDFFTKKETETEGDKK